MFWKTLKKLCDEHGTTVNAVCKELGFSNAAATHWKNGKNPKAETVKLFADYFGVSIDYMLTGEDIKKEPLPVSELRKQLDEVCDSMSEDEQRQMLEIGKLIRDAHALRNQSSPE